MDGGELVLELKHVSGLAAYLSGEGFHGFHGQLRPTGGALGDVVVGLYDCSCLRGRVNGYLGKLILDEC